MKKHFTSKINMSPYRKIVLWLAVGLSIVSAFLLTFPSLASAQTSDDQFCKANASIHVSTCGDILKLIGSNHILSDMLNLLSDKSFIQKLQEYEKNSVVTPTPPKNTGPLFDTYLFRRGYRVNPTVNPTGGSGNCGPLNKPVNLNQSSETLTFFNASVNLATYSFNLNQGCSYQASWNLGNIKCIFRVTNPCSYYA